MSDIHPRPPRLHTPDFAGPRLAMHSAMEAHPQRERRRRGSSQKSMLSRALQKANTAVLLDNAANFEGAIDAYSDACDLLHQVMRRTNGAEEKQKLEEIRSTYTTRIAELRRLGLSSRAVGKALPDRPLSDESVSPTSISFRSEIHDDADEDDMYVIETATATRIFNKPSYLTDPDEPRALPPSQIPPRRQSLLPSAFDEEVRFWKPLDQDPLRVGSSSNLPILDEQLDKEGSPSGMSSEGRGPFHRSPSREPPLPPRLQSQQSEHRNEFLSFKPESPGSIKPTSWLDNGDSGGSSASSLRSRSSSLYLRKRDHISSGGTEAAFDAALDAAVEAAYDQGLEPADDLNAVSGDDDVVLNVRRNVERAKQKVREAELEVEAISAQEREIRRIKEETLHGDLTALNDNYEDEEAQEEELILEEMMDVLEFDSPSKSGVPRQSGSSGFSGRTWGSSIASNPATTGTSLSTLAEENIPSSLDAQLAKVLSASRLTPRSPSAVANTPPASPSPSRKPPLPAPPPQFNLPSTLPPLPTPTLATVTPNSPLAPSVRTRRLSSHDLKDLSIETNAKLPPGAEAPRTVAAPESHSHSHSQTKNEISANGTSSWQSLEPIQRLRSRDAASSAESLTIISPVTSFHDLQRTDTNDDTLNPATHRVLSKVASNSETLKKDNPVAQSKLARGKVLTVTTDDITKGLDSPFVSAFPTSARRGTYPLPTSASAPGAHYLFDDAFHSPLTPGYPDITAPNPPTALEPCPQSFLLRPFWMMRCIYQSITHPRGAYMTTKLFIPRDVWKVKNVKLKAVEEKVANCDLLTAALLKVAQVDTNDADAVLEEMQSFESVLDQVQTVWAKKLGNEVGVHGTSHLFKSSTDDHSSFGEQSSRSSSGGSKSYLTSWRKLRSKSSGPNTVPQTARRDSNKDLTLNSLPMDDTLNVRRPRRILPDADCTGPNANYMSALARLCDAAQVIDQIARQVEDPGLKHSSKTLVGLELSSRHAAEFFGFYVCRFALHDIGLMIDKFIKRGSEWVLV
ncbi:hypothetical protein LOZ53_004132 [Ophidiomyces ophidiicola]|nr:hypothetical protein LOZ54_003629 [Ophidiomyces ophidiicola]KAI1987965.1 hypothetical protein LOZ53_004132 [Ophidiomyces ophidiicola]KAI2051221.1 hypothetical protein LOZ43_004801 [Ophidiomyces ophidiicola]KAI2142057.1 hypothetical protein LOZ29_001547 [Ophidiomyces ophidiicola]KAI2221075.1 hypothetical protein LOZ15_001935 [Ophidiomyces ophidiicola]